MQFDDLAKRLEDRPFKPFLVHLTDGMVIPVERPGMVIASESSAVLPTEFSSAEGRRVAGNWQTVALIHMVRSSDAPEAGERGMELEHS